MLLKFMNDAYPIRERKVMELVPVHKHRCVFTCVCRSYYLNIFCRTHLILFYAHCKSIMCKLWMSGCCLVVAKTASHTFTWHLVSTDTCITPLNLDHFIQYVFKIRKRWSFLVLYTSNKRFLFLYFILKTMAIYFSLKILLRKWTFLFSFFQLTKHWYTRVQLVSNAEFMWGDVHVTADPWIKTCFVNILQGSKQDDRCI